MQGRDPSTFLAAPRVNRGTDIDFGMLTAAYLEPLIRDKALELNFGTEVVDLFRCRNNLWNLALQSKSEIRNVTAAFVFLGAGAGLSLIHI